MTDKYTMPLPGESWDEFTKRKKTIKKTTSKSKSKSKNPKGDLENAIEENQLQSIQHKINNGVALNAQDSTMIAKWLPNTPGFEAYVDNRSKSRKRFDSLTELYKNSTITNQDKYELMNSNLYDWNTDPLGFKMDEQGKVHPNNPEYKTSQEKKEKAEAKSLKIEEKKKLKESKTKKLINNIKDLTAQKDSMYKSDVQNQINMLENIENSINLPSNMPNLYVVNYTNTGDVSIKIQEPNIRSFMESPLISNFSEDAKLKLWNDINSKLPEFKKKIGEINRNFIKYNQKVKLLNEKEAELDRLRYE
jgi:hypothetical protein